MNKFIFLTIENIIIKQGVYFIKKEIYAMS